MVRKKIIKIFLIIFLSAASLVAQEGSQIYKKKNELSKIKDEINYLQNQLKLKSKKERESFNVLENYNKQSFLLHSLISKLQSEEQDLELQISTNEAKVSGLRKDISSLKENYSKYVVSAYEHGELDDWVSLLDADSFEQAFLRYKYLKKFSERRQKDLYTLKVKKDSLNIVKARLESDKQDKILLSDQKQSEEKNLNLKRKERKEIIKTIRNDKEALLSQIDAKKGAELKIKNLINKLIEEAELKRKAEEARIAAEKARKAKNKKLAVPNNNTVTGRKRHTILICLLQDFPIFHP